MVNRGAVEMNGWYAIIVWVIVFGLLAIYCDKLTK
jgi:hypothetical protein